ncbi:hypothetical protein [Vibrio campbellii]|uniref:hypothetical protein n=1 Tax=Vibrio campbellii TaxID=680 RepID=UPI000CD351B8|nr:hypothetical protein [Vibrio campbellii]AUW07464.1 hypothetical protein C1N51_27890 [Vibrio campbellii]
MIRVITFFVGLVLGVSSVAAQEIILSWSGIVPALVKPVVAESGHFDAVELFSSKQDSHPQLVVGTLIHDATNTEIKILKMEL